MVVRYQAIDEDPYMSLEVDRLVTGRPLNFEVWIREGSVYTPLFNPGERYDESARDLLAEKGISSLFVRRAEKSALDEYFSRSGTAEDAGLNLAAITHYHRAKERHVPVDRSLLLAGVHVPFSLFSVSLSGVRKILAGSEQRPGVVNEEMLGTEGEIAVQECDIPLYQAYLDSFLTSGRIGEKKAQKIKTRAMKENAKLLLRGLLEEPRSGEKIKKAVDSVREMVACILENRDALSDLLSIRTYDAYTYAHSVNVAALSVGLGISMGMNRSDVEQLGIGALLHDLGKSTIPRTVLNKPARLSDDEFRVMKTHVMEGERLLRVHASIPDKSFLAVIQHHEKLSGRGYPRGSSGREVTLFGRITSIIDCYDAITTRRPYQPPRTPFYAVSVITSEKGDYDPDITAQFIRTLGNISA